MTESDRDEWAESLHDATLDYGIDKAAREMREFGGKFAQASARFERLQAEKQRRTG